jgi:hypothetical protein
LNPLAEEYAMTEKRDDAQIYRLRLAESPQGIGH